MRSAAGHSAHDWNGGYYTAGVKPDWFRVSGHAAGKFAGSSAVHDQSYGDTNHASEYDFSLNSPPRHGDTEFNFL
jgi:hypothetical protein